MHFSVFKYESNPQMLIYLLIHIGLLIINIYHETKGKTAFINILSVSSKGKTDRKSTRLNSSHS